MICNFFAILTDGSLRKINLLQKITPSIKNIFVDNGNYLLNDDTEEIKFDGNYVVQEDEVLYVNMALPNELTEAMQNSIEIPILDLNNDQIKTLFWHDAKTYYFQNFDNRKLLRNKSVIFYDKQTYNKLEENAFVIESVVNAIYKNGKFYFVSYANANKIFSLLDFYEAASDEKIEEFAKHKNVIFDEVWLIANTNTLIRKQITLLQKSKILDKANTKKIQSKAKKFNLAISVDAKGKIIFPNDKKEFKEILIFLNEQYYIGLISGNKYKTNSKRNA
jgi:hypothetical protein